MPTTIILQPLSCRFTGLKQPSSQFLGKKLTIKPCFYAAKSKTKKKNLLRCFVVTASNELIDAVHNLFIGVGVGLPCTVMECGDFIYRSTLPRSNGLTVTAPGAVLALGALSYLWATPGVAPGFFDMFVLAFVERVFRRTYRKDDFVLGKKLGEGAFGVVYKVSLTKNSSKVSHMIGQHSTKPTVIRLNPYFNAKSTNHVKTSS